jgi:hypothetical protein
VVQNLVVPSTRANYQCPFSMFRPLTITCRGSSDFSASCHYTLGLNPGHPAVPHLAIYQLQPFHIAAVQSRYQILAASSVLSAKHGQNHVADLWWWGAQRLTVVDNLVYRNKCAISLRYTSSRGSGTVRS